MINSLKISVIRNIRGLCIESARLFWLPGSGSAKICESMGQNINEPDEKKSIALKHKSQLLTTERWLKTFLIC